MPRVPKKGSLGCKCVGKYVLPKIKPAPVPPRATPKTGLKGAQQIVSQMAKARKDAAKPAKAASTASVSKFKDCKCKKGGAA